MEGTSEYLAVFSQEASEQLQTWEQSLLALERHPDDRDELDSLFRAIHTLKGAAGFIDFEKLGRVAHELESTLSDVRDGGRSFDPRLGDILFRGLDLARGMIDKFTAGQENAADVDGFLDEVKTVAGAASDPGAQPQTTPSVLEDGVPSDGVPSDGVERGRAGWGASAPRGAAFPRPSDGVEPRPSDNPASEAPRAVDPATSYGTSTSIRVLAVAIAGPPRGLPEILPGQGEAGPDGDDRGDQAHARGAAQARGPIPVHRIGRHGHGARRHRGQHRHRSGHGDRDGAHRGPAPRERGRGGGRARPD